MYASALHRYSCSPTLARDGAASSRRPGGTKTGSAGAAAPAINRSSNPAAVKPTCRPFNSTDVIPGCSCVRRPASLSATTIRTSSGMAIRPKRHRCTTAGVKTCEVRNNPTGFGNARSQSMASDSSWAISQSCARLKPVMTVQD